MAVRTKLLVDSVDAYVLSMPSPVNRQRRCLHPVVRERSALVGQLQSILRDLGLERRARDATDLATQFAALHAARRSEDGHQPSPPAPGGSPGSADVTAGTERAT